MQGSLFFTVRAADSAFPVESATIVITSPEGEVLGEEAVSAENGSVSRNFLIDAPDPTLSLSPGEDTPYATCDAIVSAQDFHTFHVKGIQIFGGERCVLPLEMIPMNRDEEEVVEFTIPAHNLCDPQEKHVIAPPPDLRILRQVFIPEQITVHLGAPNASAANVTVPFVDYIKNVASSEIYPTWPEESLKANILCQISLALNRIFTEWYPSRGYNFNITNSTAYDQYFVYGRNIFDNVAEIVDQIFNQYIRRPGRVEPFFAEYCNGSTVSCPGLSQWGSVSLANAGRSAREILEFYYGNVEIVETRNIRAIESSYPGSPLRTGSSGQAVRSIQRQLNRIRENYPGIPAISPEDGVYGAQTESAVRAFQKTFNLTQDGVVGESTWYRISYIYVAVKKLAELASEGENPQYDNDSYPGLLRLGDTGNSVENLQFYLKTIAAYNPFLAPLEVDGVFGPATENAVLAFQRTYSLAQDGIVGEVTWDRIVKAYQDVLNEEEIATRPYPGTLLRIGSSGSDVRYEQTLLNRIRPVFATVGALETDGVFGSRMRASVVEFQSLFGLSADGIIGRDTWNELNRVFEAVQAGCLDRGETQTGRILRYGSQGSDVSQLQRQLNLAGTVLAPIPTLKVDGAFGRSTEEAVKVFQKIFGLSPDGVVGNLTRTRLYDVTGAIETGCLSPGRTSRARAAVREAAPEETVSWKKAFLSQDEPRPEDAPFAVAGEQETRRMKEALKQKGFLSPGILGEKSLFAPSLKKALTAFQRAKGLPVTGVADEKTLKALYEEE